MDIGSILFIISLFILTALFVARPLMEPKNGRREAVSKEEHDYSHLLAERDRLINALQELDFDYALGKIPDEDYPAQRALLLQRGADVLRQIDQFNAAAGAAVVEEEAEKRMEAAVAARRADLAAVPVNGGRRTAPVGVAPDDDLEAALANRRRERAEKAAGFCPQCGNAVRKSDKFCPKCGSPLD